MITTLKTRVMNSRVSVRFMLLSVIFCSCLLLANILEVKIIKSGYFTVTAGLMLFPVTYILNDCIVEVWGYRKSRLVIWLGFTANLIAALFTWIAVLLPPDPVWNGQEAFEAIFTVTPRITLASLVAFIAGSFVNAYIMSRMKVASKGKRFSLRAIVSTLAGEGIDSVVFFPAAFWGILPGETILNLIIAQALLKTLYEIAVLPVTIRVVKLMKKYEKSDIYDNSISYNILKVRDL